MRARFAALLAIALLLLAGCATPPPESAAPGSGTTTTRSPGTVTTSPPSETPDVPDNTTEDEALGTIEARLERRSWDGPISMPMRLALYATFRGPTGIAHDTPEELNWTIHVLGPGYSQTFPVDATAGHGLPGAADFLPPREGTYYAVARVTAPGYEADTDEQTMRATDLPVPPVLFEGGESAPTLAPEDHRMVGVAPFTEVVDEPGSLPPPPGWHRDGNVSLEGRYSWASRYHDNMRTTLTSNEFTLGVDGGFLVFWARGGAENNTVDGLYATSVLPDGPDSNDDPDYVDLLHLSGPFEDWSPHFIELDPGVQRLEFRFDADSVCSGDTNPAAGAACLEGYDAGGFWLDNVAVWSN